MPEIIREIENRRMTINTNSSAADAVGTLSADKDVDISGFCAGQFTMLDLAEAILFQLKPGAVVDVATWSIGERDTDRVLAHVQTGRIKSVRFMLDSSLRKRSPKQYEMLVSRLGSDRLRITRTHAKFFLISDGDIHVVLRGSLNMTENNKLEQFDISTGWPLYAFYQDVVDRYFETTEPDRLSDRDHEINAEFRTACQDLDTASEFDGKIPFGGGLDEFISG